MPASDATDWTVESVTYAELDLPYVRPLRVGIYLVPGRFVARFQHPKFDELEMAVDVDPVTHALSCTRLTCRDTSPGERIVGSKLRQLPIDRMLRAALVEAARTASGGLVAWSTDDIEGFSGSHRPHDPKSRWALTPEHLAEVARVYREAIGDPSSPGPVEAVARHWKRPRSTAARWVAAARRTDPPLLGPTTRGRAGEGAQ